ncbi:MAG: cytochrome c biogenesis protein CcdA [Candidatus Doudnabacteria bacterium]
MIPLSLTVAFIGGMLSLLPACGPALLPAFFGYTFKEKRSLVLATIFFACGFALIFFPFSLGLNFLIRLLVYSRPVLYALVGWFLVAFGLLALFNFTLPVSARSPGFIDKPWQTFFLGIIFGLTSSTCTAPIYGAILSLNSLSQGFWQTGILLLVFLAGMIVPLLVLALLIDKYGLFKFDLFRKPLITITIGSFSRPFFLGNFIASMLFIPLGLSFVLSKGGASFLSMAESSGILLWFEKVNESLIVYNSGHLYLDFWVLGLLLVIGLALWLNVRERNL